MSDAVSDGGVATEGLRQPDRARVLGCTLDRVDMEAALAVIDDSIAQRRYCQHAAVNAAKVVAMDDDEELRSAVNDATLVTADGQAVVWAARMLGDPLPGRVAGIDLMYRTLDLAERRGYRVYILGARDEVLERAVGRLRELHPRLELAGYRDGYFDESEDASVAETIRVTGADILFVAISSPRKEYFIGRHGPDLGVPFVMGVGGSVDVIAGLTRRAPRWAQRAGVEWVFRLAQEPRRLFGRYLRTNAGFIAMLVRQLFRRRPAAE